MNMPPSQGLRSSLAFVRYDPHRQCSHPVGTRLLSALEPPVFVAGNEVELTMGSVSSSLPPPSAAFEPVVNTPALGAFLFVFVTFALLQARILSVNAAAKDRKDALELLRDVKRRELATDGSDAPQQDEIERATKAFEQSIEDEEARRTILPGIRIIAPGATTSKEDANAQFQFLGKELPTPPEPTETANGLDGPAVALLALIGVSQIALLVLLSFDPVGQSSPLLGPQ